jgi:2-polyprenyl-3-methyl-5-hydroxy-6-metoxy-1,4-benzoquinol methylase
MYDFQKYFNGKNVLEVGPNKGALFEKYYPKTKKFMLLEPNEHFEKDFIKLQKKYPNVSYEIKGFEAFNTEEKFDTIVMMAVISHIPLKSQKIFEKINSMLNHGGFLIIETNNTQRNLDVYDLVDQNYEKIEEKASYNGPMKWLKIDYRNVLVYRKA